MFLCNSVRVFLLRHCVIYFSVNQAFRTDYLGCRRQNRFQPPVLVRTYILVLKSINSLYVLIFSSHSLQTHVTALLRPGRKQ